MYGDDYHACNMHDVGYHAHTMYAFGYHTYRPYMHEPFSPYTLYRSSVCPIPPYTLYRNSVSQFWLSRF